MQNSKVLFSSLAHKLAAKLAAEGLISEAAIQEALIQAAVTKTPFVVYLVKHNLINPRVLALAAAHDFGLPLLDLDVVKVDVLPRKLVSEKLIQALHAVPLYQRGEQLFIAISDPINQAAIDEVKSHTGLHVYPVLVEEHKLQRLIKQLTYQGEYVSSPKLAHVDLNQLQQAFDDMPAMRDVANTEHDDAPIVRFVQQILMDGIKKQASDLHFEAYEQSFRIRMRQDGIMYTIASPPLTIASRIVSRIKVMAELNIAERRLPQDGRFKLKVSNHHAVDFRVSTCPTVTGEKLVMRILDPANTNLNIDTLGFEAEQKAAFLQAIQRTQGMMLVVGPTGSGKTVSLYTALQILNTDAVNICTVEDPVEINLPGVNQVQVNPKIGLSFATTMRTFLRQDPDIIMIGEMRDLETAEIGIKAAQTGHLVLSTLHTNNAPETLTRLVNMGIAPFNIATSITLIAAQRLIRKLCELCKREEKIPQAALLAEGFKRAEQASLKIFGPVGCEHCTTGYKGRTGIYEILPVTEAIGQAIMAGGTAFDITNIAVKEGMQTLRQSGLNKIRLGITSLEEINRVTKE